MKVHPQTVLDKIATGELPAAKMGRSYVLMTKTVLDHIEAQIIKQMAARLGSAVTTGVRRGRSRAGSHTSSSSGGSCGR